MAKFGEEEVIVKLEAQEGIEDRLFSGVIY